MPNVSLSLSLSHALCLSLPLSLFVSLSHSTPLSLYPSLTLSVFLSLSLSHALYLSLSLPLSLSISLSPSLTLSLYPSLTLSVFLSLSLSRSPSTFFVPYPYILLSSVSLCLSLVSHSILNLYSFFRHFFSLYYQIRFPSSPSAKYLQNTKIF